MGRKISKPKKSDASKSSNFIAKAPIRRLMKNEGANLVSNDAVLLLVKKLESIAADVTKTAAKIVKNDKRKRLTKQDIVYATR